MKARVVRHREAKIGTCKGIREVRVDLAQLKGCEFQFYVNQLKLFRKPPVCVLSVLECKNVF